MERDGRFFIQALTNDSKNMTSDQVGSLVFFRILEFFVVPRLRAEAHDGRFTVRANGRVPFLYPPSKQTLFTHLSPKNFIQLEINCIGSLACPYRRRFVKLRAAGGRAKST